MDTALEKVFAFGEVSYVHLAALEDARLGDGHIGESARALLNRLLVRSVEAWYESAPKLRYFGKSMRLTALVRNNQGRPFLNMKNVGFEVPAWVGSTGRGLSE